MFPLLQLTLFFPFFLAVCSILLFFLLELFRGGGFVIFESSLAAIFAVIFFSIRRKGLFPFRATCSGEVDRRLSASFWFVLGAALLFFISLSLRQPGGEWDAWAIWNARARFIYRLGEQWRDAFNPLLAHPDYPLLLPLSVVFGWKALGQESSAVPILVGTLFTFCTVALLLFSIAHLRGWKQGLLGGLVLLGSPFFLRQGAAQCADVPLGFFYLSTFVFFAFYEKGQRVNHWLIMLAGLTAGFATWTKNEGFLFCLSIIVARLSTVIAARGVKSALCEAVFFLSGLAVPLATVFFFKMQLAPPGDLFNAQGPLSLLEKLSEPSRYGVVLKAYLLTGIKFTKGLAGVPLLLVYFMLMGKDATGTHKVELRTCMYALSLMLTGFFFVYVMTPHDLAWHLKTSLGRLFLQLWPSFLFWFFLGVRGFRQEVKPFNQ